MDVKSSLEKPTWHGGEFYPELIRKSMFPSWCMVMVHNMLIKCLFFTLWLPHFHECVLIGNVCLGFCSADILWHTRCGRNQAWLQLVKLTVGHRGGEEEGS